MEQKKIIVLDRGDYTTCTVNLQGATVISWTINNQEQLFVSRESHSHEYSHVMGGIQLVFPHFGAWSFGPKQGFARTLHWILEEGPQCTDEGDVFAVFTLCDDSYTHALWGYKFKVSYRVTLLKTELVFGILVENLCHSAPFDFHIMQHSLFRVPDVTKCEVVGLKACTYKNIPLGEAVHVENKEVVTFSGYTNKTYMHIPEEVTVRNMMDGKELKIRQRKTTDINLWNPGSESSTSVVNLGDGEYKHFIAIKTGLLTEPLHLEPANSWEATHSFEVVEQRRDKKLLSEIYDFLSGFC